MCGRYALTSPVQELVEEFSISDGPQFELPPNYNVAPQTEQPVIRANPMTNQPEIVLMKWGLIPFSSTESKVPYATINARAEDAALKRAFRGSLETRRCLIPANLFYEWKTLSPKQKQPHAIAMADGSVFAFAGLWDRWQTTETFTILTTDPNELMRTLHNRMPCILDRSEYARWLAPCDPRQPPRDLLKPHPADRMRIWPVTPRVGNVHNNDIDLIRETSALPSDDLPLFAD